MGWILLSLAIGFALGLAVAFALRLVQARTAQQLAQELFTASEQQRVAENQALADRLKAEFGGLAGEALSKNTEQFLALARERLNAEQLAGAKEIAGTREAIALDLDSKRSLIDQRLGTISDALAAQLGEVITMVQRLEGDRRHALGEVTERLNNAGEVISKLTAVTSSLREAIGSTRTRGQWGERMAEDVLRAAGFIEGVNYSKQATLIEGTRPDFTFLLPKERTLNMDVKFPLDNYLRMLDAQNDMDRVRFKKDFLKDVRARMKEVTTRAYIDPQQGTCDYALLFIPNESIYQFVHAEDAELLDAALRAQVVFCSPITLFAVLAVIRVAVDQFAMEKTSNEIVALIGAFHKQWGMFTESLERVGKRIEDAGREYETCAGTRRRMLERPLKKIEELRSQQQLPVVDEQLAMEA